MVLPRVLPTQATVETDETVESNARAKPQARRSPGISPAQPSCRGGSNSGVERDQLQRPTDQYAGGINTTGVIYTEIYISRCGACMPGGGITTYTSRLDT